MRTLLGMRLVAAALLALVLSALAQPPAPPAPAPGSTALVQGFETDIPIEPWPPDSPNRLEFSEAWQSQGKRSLKIGGQLMAAVQRLRVRDWRGYSVLRFTMNNPTAHTVRVGFELQDQHTPYYERHQDGFGLEPGVHVIDMDLSGPLWRGEQNRPYRGEVATPIELGQISRVSFYNHGDEAVYLDGIEVVAEPPARTPGGWAFDFGPARAPVTRGWTAITPAVQVSPRAQYGFVEAGAQSPEQFMSFPTPALGDGVGWPPSGFAATLAGGAYVGWVAFERGGFWEDQGASYRKAALSCNGVVAHQHTFSPAGTRFLFQDVELTDMAQVAERLVWPAHAVARFRFAAAPGTNVFRLDVTGASGLPLRVAALAVAPDTPAGRAYLDGLVADQQRLVRRTFAPLDRGRRGDDRREPTRPLVVESLPVGEMMYPRDWPTRGEGEEPGEMVAVAGQQVTVHLGVYARRADRVTVTAAPLKGPGPLPSPTVAHGRYLPMRPYGTGVAWLEVNHYRPEPVFDVGPELARSVLVEYAVPADAPPGLYQGTVELRGEKAQARVPLRLRVLRVPLPEIPIPVGLFMNALAVPPGDLPEVAWWRLQESLLQEQGRAGLNCLTGGPGLRYEVVEENGRVEARGAAALRYIRLAQRFGTIRAVVPYGGFLPHLRTVAANPKALAEAIGRLEAEQGLPPHYVYAYDEPSTASELKQTLEYLVRARDGGLRTIGYTSWHEDNPRWQTMVAATYAPALNGHTGGQLAQLAQLRSQGKEPWVYNNGLDRVGMGLRLWRSMQLGAAGRLQWIGLFTQGFAFNNLDGREPSRSCFLVHDQLGVLKTPVWLAVREGLLDLRLRLALEQRAPADDAALGLWTVEGYRQDEAEWTVQRLDEVRARTLERLESLSDGVRR